MGWWGFSDGVVEKAYWNMHSQTKRCHHIDFRPLVSCINVRPRWLSLKEGKKKKKKKKKKKRERQKKKYLVNCINSAAIRETHHISFEFSYYSLTVKVGEGVGGLGEREGDVHLFGVLSRTRDTTKVLVTGSPNKQRETYSNELIMNEIWVLGEKHSTSISISKSMISNLNWKQFEWSMPFNPTAVDSYSNWLIDQSSIKTRFKRSATDQWNLNRWISNWYQFELITMPFPWIIATGLE